MKFKCSSVPLLVVSSPQLIPFEYIIPSIIIEHLLLQTISTEQFIPSKYLRLPNVIILSHIVSLLELQIPQRYVEPGQLLLHNRLLKVMTPVEIEAETLLARKLITLNDVSVPTLIVHQK